MSDLSNNTYLIVAFFVIFVFYSSVSYFTLPVFVENLLENPIFIILFLSLVVYYGNKNPTLTIIIVAVYLLIVNMISEYKVKRAMQQIEKFQEIRLLK